MKTLLEVILGVMVVVIVMAMAVLVGGQIDNIINTQQCQTEMGVEI